MRGARSPARLHRYDDAHPLAQRVRGRLWAIAILLSWALPVCVYLGSAGAARVGLGVSRAALQSVLTRREFAFRFETPDARQGLPRVTGTVPGKLIVLDLVGPPDDLTAITLIVGVPSTDPLARPTPQALAENQRYLRAVLQRAMPDWKDGVQWLDAQLQRPAERLEVGLRKGHREVVLLAANHFSMVLLSIRAAQPPATCGP